MKFSVFTPTHDAKHLRRAGESLAAQTIAREQIEWLVVCNNGAGKGEVQALLGDLPLNIRVMQAPEVLQGVGALKRWACNNASGDVFVELDHDDELMPECLAALQSRFSTGADFVSSATFEIKPDGGDVWYSPQYGWQHDKAMLNGKERSYHVPFDIGPRTLAQIFYAPNHVRAWAKDAYWKAGGHDAKLEICDDHDLLIRTYLSGAKMEVIKQPLYVQHMHGGNTQTARNADIQTATQTLCNQHTRPLVEEWCRRSCLPLYDFGGAHDCPTGYLPVDIAGGEGVLRLDVTQGLPWADNSVGAIRAHDFLEHVPIGQVVPLMNEIHRVLAPGGWLLTHTPSTDGRGAFQDPTHVSFWNENSWWYYTQAAQAKYVPSIKARFQAARLFTWSPSAWHEEHLIAYVVADMVAMKGQRVAGWNGFYEATQQTPTSP